MVIPFQITLIPMYILMVKFGWVDSYMALIVPGMISAFGILLFRQFFMDIPQDLIDAAKIDGCNDFGVLFKIIYPLSKPVIITVGIVTFMGSWNDVLWPLIVNSSAKADDFAANGDDFLRLAGRRTDSWEPNWLRRPF
jgi:ABC-type glycerol-3-phosphate transport system permease component